MLQAHRQSAPVPALPPLARKIRALLLDDSSFDRARIRRLSSKTDLPIDMDEVDSIGEMTRAFDQQIYDLVLIDYRLPIGDGLVALDHVKNDPLNKAAGKIMITANGAIDTAVAAMRGGYHDFLSKDDMSADALRSSILTAMAEAQNSKAMQDASGQDHARIRAGLLAALEDEEVTGNVMSLMRRHFSKGPGQPNDKAAFDLMIAGLRDTDEFIFH